LTHQTTTSKTKRKPDFRGVASAYDVRCDDGVVIAHGAFDHQIGTRLPLMNNHGHGNMANVLGHVILTKHPKGIGFDAYTNATENGVHAKILVHSGDIRFVSIWANKLQRDGDVVRHGNIREVSLVISGQNPGALIEEAVVHSADGLYQEVYEGQYIIHSGYSIDFEEVDAENEQEEDIRHMAQKTDLTIEEVLNSLTEDQKKAAAYLIHAAAGTLDTEEDDDEDDDVDGESLADIFETMSEEQKNVVFYYVGTVLEGVALASQQDDEVKQSQQLQEQFYQFQQFQQFQSQYGDDDMAHSSNVFNSFGNQSAQDLNADRRVILDELVHNAIKDGGQSFRRNFVSHAATFGFEDLGLLFPDGQTVGGSEPLMVQTPDEWVSDVLPKATKLPFNRIKSRYADITEEEARARGYIKSSEKLEQVYALFSRVTYPQTIFTKQKMDRDDVLDITDFNIVLYMKKIMRIKWDEEVSRAILVSDGRATNDPLKISEENVRPIYKDHSVYTKRVEIPLGDDTLDVIDAFVVNMHLYKGSGNPTLFTSVERYSEMMVVRDTTGRRVHDNASTLYAALGVSSIVKVPFLTNLTRTVTDGGVTKTLKCVGILVNMKDYSVGFNPGANATMLEDFDIDFNQHVFVYEGRLAGALVVPASAIVFEQVVPNP